MSIIDHVLFGLWIAWAMFLVYGVFWKGFAAKSFKGLTSYPVFSVFIPKTLRGFELLARALALFLLVTGLASYVVLLWLTNVRG